MKIGEAGEAFFVFETDSDVPEDLITSPLLEPTQPVSPEPPPPEDFGRFGTRDCRGDLMDDGLGQEPDFLDLNAPTSLPKEASKTSASSNLSDTPCLRPASPSHKPIPFPSLHPPSASLPSPPHHTSISLPQCSATSDEYSWEWGGFPQRSQIRIEYDFSGTAPKAAHGTETDVHLVVSQPEEFQRSKILPPEFELDLTQEVPSASLQLNAQLNGQDLLSDVETGFDHDPNMLGREYRSWARWWRRDNRHPRRVDVHSERPPLQSAVSAPLPSVSCIYIFPLRV